MNCFKLLVIGAAMAALLITQTVRMPETVHAQGNTPKEAEPVAVFQAAGPNAAAIQGTVDAYRLALGDLNGNAAGPLAAGRRQIDWDGGGGVDATTAGAAAVRPASSRAWPACMPRAGWKRRAPARSPRRS